MERIVITENDIKNANTYMPVTQKWVAAKFIAQLVVETKPVAIMDGGEKTAIPDMADRNTLREAMFKTGVFVKEYMRKGFDPVHTEESKGGKPIQWLMSADDTDRWGNFEAQIDRMKRSKTPGVADACYEMLNDYHQFLRMLNIEIEQEMALKNDPVGRTLMANKMNALTPDDLNELLETLKKIEAEKAKE